MEQKEIKEINQVYTRFWGGEIAMETYSVQVVLHHLPEGLLRCSVSTIDQERCWLCEHTGKESLDKLCSHKELGREEVLWIYGGLLKNLKEVREYLLDANCLMLDPKQIYVNLIDAKVWNCYVPFYVKNVWQSLQELSQYLLGYINKQDAEAVKIAYSMYRYFSQGGRNLEEAWAILCDSMEEKDRKKEPCDEKEKSDETVSIPDETCVEKTINKAVFPIFGWIIMGLSGAFAVFLFAYVAFNEWYLPNSRKIFLLLLAVVFAVTAFLSWIRWGSRMKKKNPMDEEI